MSPRLRTSRLPGVLCVAVCGAAVVGCGEEPQPVTQRPTAHVSLTLRAQAEGVFTLGVVDLMGASDDAWLGGEYSRIAQQLTPANIGADRVKDITVEGQQITVRTVVQHAADCELQAERIETLLSNLYSGVRRVDARTREATPADLDAFKAILAARAEAAGVSDLSVRPRPPDSLVVEFACAGDPTWATALLTDTGLFEFRAIPRRYAYEHTAVGQIAWRDDTGTAVDVSDVVAESPVMVSGRDFAPTSEVEKRPGYTCVTFSLQNEASDAFHTFTRDHVNTYLAMVFDGELIACPIIRSAILGEGVIMADFDEPGGSDRAEKLAMLINSGPFPLDLECIESTTEELPP